MGESPSDRSTVKRKPERAAYDRATVDSVLDEGLICHVGFHSDDQTFVIPMLHVRMGDKLYLHGSPASRTLRTLSQGAEVCVTVTLIDGLVLARSAMHHSMNYRSVVLFGRASLVEDPVEKRAVLEALTEHLVPGRWADARGPNDRELERTQVVSVPIREASAKVRTGPPVDDDADYALPVWAGVIPLRLAAGSPIGDPRLETGVPPPGYASHYQGPRCVPPRQGG
jgi:nitroimidazol reductase NimA-like FMN-containing flavoprotein (pyridoxamine 5'-phosphate oxidase superfamily)